MSERAGTISVCDDARSLTVAAPIASVFGKDGRRASRPMGYFEDVQATVRNIPRGKVATYGEVARAAGYRGTARQVAWALQCTSAKGIPWQRVVGADGVIKLPGESGLYQRLLLEMEGVAFSGRRIRMDRCEFRFSAHIKQKTAKRGRR